MKHQSDCSHKAMALSWDIVYPEKAVLSPSISVAINAMAGVFLLNLELPDSHKKSEIH